MSAISPTLLVDLTAALREAGRSDLVERLMASTQPAVLTSTEAASLLGVASANTVKNWLEGGHFPGAFQTPGGHWRFPREEVEAVMMRMEDLRGRNRQVDLMPVGGDEESIHPPLP
ncbi:helix-turn-helix domain-containing protein [Cyanobium sp. WAJ14-Wanaka]|uniref:helix-turn-helix domain-containing protein n=1 Tax=Cyanobium sp. WAJ14-Wanaka TaxID=2823725 RepID=UPI0020CE64C0|nr:helix-turn-helix domain-containing protein [Cyanobium sp. WAJ14-Wanaka]MCP9774308.1 helix-turn-helix domain-containing protein [Cyanobium sp. WAJ14-Wanaka]